jgi:hypothetical protein
VAGVQARMSAPNIDSQGDPSPNDPHNQSAGAQVRNAGFEVIDKARHASFLLAAAVGHYRQWRGSAPGKRLARAPMPAGERPSC